MSDFVSASNVFVNTPAATVKEAFEFLAEKAVEQGIADDKNAVVVAFEAREREGTTGMQNGFAIPHAKSEAIDKAAIFVVKFAEPIAEWESLDKSPVKVAIALLVPGGEVGTTHLKLLSKVAILLMDESFHDQVLDSDDPAAIAAVVNKGLDE